MLYQARYYLIWVFVLLFLPSGTSAVLEPVPPSVRINSVKIGFDNYYRRGYWSPLRLQITAVSQPFKGILKCMVDTDCYINQLDIPINQSQEVSCPVIIYSPKPDIKIIFIDEHTKREFQYPLNLKLKDVSHTGFLIGIEKSLYHIFRAEFLRYSEAAQFSCFFAFTPEELPDDWRLYEAIDLLVLPEEFSLPTSLQETLMTWQYVSGGNILSYTRGSAGIRLGGLNLIRHPRHSNPSIEREVYRLGLGKPWRGYFKERIGNFLVLYFIILFIIGLLGMWWRLKKYSAQLNVLKFALLPLSTLVVLIILTIILSYWFILPKSFRVYDIYQITTLDSGYRLPNPRVSLVACHQLIRIDSYLDEVQNKQFSLVKELSNNMINYPDRPALPLLKPLYREETSSFGSPFTYTLVRQGEDNFIQPLFRLRRNECLFLETSFTYQLPGKFSIDAITVRQGAKGYRITNETPLRLNFCGLLTDANSKAESIRIAYLGEFPAGHTQDISFSETDWGSLESMKMVLFAPSQQASQVRQWLFEYWYNKYVSTGPRANNELILFGWTENHPIIINQTDCLGVNYHPILWIIPLGSS